MELESESESESELELAWDSGLASDWATVMEWVLELDLGRVRQCLL